MYRVRLFAVRHSRFFQRFYKAFEAAMVALDPISRRIGYNRLEKPVAVTEKLVKGLLFDCKMCGQCVLSSTGMSCPMNCPKQLQNGPCGGVQANGNCEVIPDMVCVWVEAERGSRLMRRGTGINNIRLAVDNTRKGTSSWLRVVREKRDQQFYGSE